MNRERLVELMREHDVAVVIGATPPNVCYLTGHVGWAQHVYRSLPCIAAFSDDGSEGTDLVVPRSETPYHAARPSTADRVAGYGGRAGLLDPGPDLVLDDEEARFEALQRSCAENRSPVDALTRLLSGREIRPRRIVVDDVHAVPGLVDRLAAEWPGVEVLAGDGLFLMARLVKTTSEIAALRRAAEVNDAALQRAMATIRAGATEAEVAAFWRREIAVVGAKPLWFHLGTGRRSSYVFPPSDRTFEPGDLFMLDAGLVYEGVLSDMGHCGTIGEPTDRARVEFEACKHAFEEAETCIRAGVLPSEIFDRLSGGLAGTALDAVVLPFAGHTIGYEAREFPFVLGPAVPVDEPFLPSTSNIPLPPGATINVEIPLGRLGWGGYQIEKTFVVSAGGCDTIVDQRAEMLVR
jgi:Xaa-Pro aminopeptidase